MAIRVYKPTSPARRFMSVLTFEEITKKEPERSLVTDLRHKAGRNHHGKITVRHIGGGILLVIVIGEVGVRFSRYNNEYNNIKDEYGITNQMIKDYLKSNK